MKSIHLIKSLIVVAPVFATTISVASCGSLLPEKRIIDPIDARKQKYISSDANTCDFFVDLKDSTQITESSEVDLELFDITVSEGVNNVHLISNKATVKDKRVSFSVAFDTKDCNSTVERSASFSVKFICRENSKDLWNQSITGYKIAKFVDTESHKITTESHVTSVTTSVDQEKLVEDTPVTLTITNNRPVSVEDAKIVLSSNEHYITLSTSTIKSGNKNTYSYSKTEIVNKFKEDGYELGQNDSIHFALVRVGCYVVRNNRLYTISKTNSYDEVSDTEVGQLGSKFLYSDNYGDLHLSSNSLTFPQFIQSCSPDHETTNEVYLLKGTYFTNGANPLSGTPFIRIHGLLAQDNKTKLSSLRTYRDYVTEGTDPNYGLAAEGIKFIIDHVNMVGRPGNNGGKYIADGMVCPYLECHYCDFTGSYTASTTECHFYNCAFNTSNTTKGTRPNLKNNNAMFLYGGSIAEFENCTFDSIGKAVKIYYGTMSESKTYKFSFKSCTFNLLKNYCNYIEYPIDIDASEHTGPTIFDITIDGGCTMNQLWKDKLAVQGATNIQLFHPKDTATSGKADHILVNNEAPVPFVWDPQTPLPDPE